MRWAGPDVGGGFQASDWLRDGGDRDYRSSSTTGQITSAGRDGRFGTSDDLVMPADPLRVSGDLAVAVTADSALIHGNTVLLNNDKVRVLAYYSASGVDTSVELVWSNDAFHTPTAQPLPLGLHAIQAVGQDAGGNGDYSGLTTVVTAPLCGASGHVDLYD